jgi:hypothetical protein
VYLTSVFVKQLELRTVIIILLELFCTVFTKYLNREMLYLNNQTDDLENIYVRRKENNLSLGKSPYKEFCVEWGVLQESILESIHLLI